MVEMVTFSEDVGGDGTTITSDRHPVTGINGGLKMVRLVKCLEQTVAVAKFITEVTQTAADYALLTTAKTLLVDNRMLLPAAPCGDVLLSDMRVYADNEVVTDYDGISVTAIDGRFYACLNEPTPVEGRGVVSYLIKVPS